MKEINRLIRAIQKIKDSAVKPRKVEILNFLRNKLSIDTVKLVLLRIV